MSSKTTTLPNAYHSPQKVCPRHQTITTRIPLTNTTPVPQHLITFEKTLFASPSTPEADVAWGNDLSPPGDGFVLIPNPSSYSLPPGVALDSASASAGIEGEIYDISVFHQLHCLNHVRTFLFTLKAGMEYNTTQQTYENLLKHQEDHVYHCFDYIRQALMCNADLTVEWPKTEADGRRIAVDGWGVQHQCKNWVSVTFPDEVRDRRLWLTFDLQDSVLEFMGKHQIPNAWRRA